MFLQSSSSITVDNFPYTIGDHVHISNLLTSKGAGSEGVVVSITAKMTRLNTGHTTKHKLMQSRPKRTMKKDAVATFIQKNLKF